MLLSHHAERRLDADLLRSWALPADDHLDKRSRGTVLVIGGSARTPGAALLAGSAALRAGAGRLQIATSPAVATALAVAVPEAMVTPYGDDQGPTLADLVGEADAVVVGPGLTDRDQAHALVALVLERVANEAVVVVDAIAIGALAGLTAAAKTLHGRLLLTPNREELRSLLGKDRAQSDGRPEAVAAVRHGAAVVSFDCVAAADGRVWIDASEVRGLGTSGAGDVLAGAAGGLAARCGDAAQAACWAAVTHRRAANRLSEAVAPVGYLARQLADEVAPALAELSR